MENNSHPDDSQPHPAQEQTSYQLPMATEMATETHMLHVQPFPLHHIYLEGDGRQEEVINKNSGFQRLDEQTGIFIKQKIEYEELLFGCEPQNKYHVYALHSDGITRGKELFKCQENSGFCARSCLTGDCRPFKMDLTTIIRGVEENIHEPFLLMERPCQCTCLCLNRLEMVITCVEGGTNQYVGKIVDPWRCCSLEMDLYDKDDHHRYSIVGSCCQCSIWCRLPYEPCRNTNFDIKNASGEIITTLQKRSEGCIQTLPADLASFALSFPENCSIEDKILLMCAMLFIDYRHFETDPKQNNP